MDEISRTEGWLIIINDLYWKPHPQNFGGFILIIDINLDFWNETLSFTIYWFVHCTMKDYLSSAIEKNAISDGWIDWDCLSGWGEVESRMRSLISDLIIHSYLYLCICTYEFLFSFVFVYLHLCILFVLCICVWVSPKK